MNSSSSCLTPFQLWPPLLSSSQLFSDHLSSSRFSQLFSTALKVFHLFPPLNSFRLFPSTLLNDSHLCPPFLSSSRLISTLLTSCHLFSTLPTASHLTSAQLISPLSQLISTSCHLLSTLLNSCQLLPTRLNSSHLFSQRCFTQGNLYTQKLLHREAFTHSKLSHREAFTQRSFYTEQAFTQRSFYTQQAFTRRSFYTEQALTSSTHNGYTNCSSKNGTTPKQKNDDFEALLKRNFIKGYRRKIISAKLEKFCCHCQSAIGNLNAATTIRFANLSCKRQAQLQQ